MNVVSAPGKALLFGEYAVLDGAPAVVTAVETRAVAFPPGEGAGELSGIVRAAREHVAAYLAGRARPSPGPSPTIDTGAFAWGGRKLGLGSSAAVAVTVVGYHLQGAGFDLRSPEILGDALALARAAHHQAQGGGSGADVAAALLGGTLRFQDGRSAALTLPPWLAVGFIDAGAPAITASLVGQVRAAAGRAPEAHAAAIARIRAASEGFLALCEGRADASAFTALVDAVRLHNEGLQALQEVSGAPIRTAAIDLILRCASEAGLAAKPSGAGGGDLVVVFAPSQAALDRFSDALLRDHGRPTLRGLRVGAPGLRPEAQPPRSSRLPGFFRFSVAARRQTLAAATGLPAAAFDVLESGHLGVDQADHLIENVIGTLELPIAVATNFRINGVDYLVPMCVEEASVVAAASNAARMIRAGGGFVATSDPPWMIAQVQLCRVGARGRDPEGVRAAILAASPALLALADAVHPRLCARGGGARTIEVRILSPDMIAVHIVVDCQDAMGANLLNSIAEALAPRLAELSGWEVGLRILSNLADRRRAHVRARIPAEALAGRGFHGDEAVDGIVAASRFAELDPYRAATHNKGIMNGIDAVILATGNDWRAIEAGAHAHACQDGRYGPLAIWRKGADGALEGHLSVPMAVGMVGGATHVHPVARLSMQILGCKSSAELGQVIAAVGLASNLAALRALATEGIQRGHMSLHARTLAAGAGAIGDEVEIVVARLIESGEIKPERARKILASLRQNPPQGPFEPCDGDPESTAEGPLCDPPLANKIRDDADCR